LNYKNNIGRTSFPQTHLIILPFLIPITISTLLLIAPSNEGDNKYNVANAQKQNNVSYQSLSDKTSSIEPIASNNNNYKIKIPATRTLISLPLSKGYVNGKIAYFIATDASDNQTAREISNNLKYNVNFAPTLALIPESSRQNGYEFLNGVRGQGAFGYQLPVASKLPRDKDYSPIVQLNFVKWNRDITGSGSTFDNHTSNTARELKSVSEIMSAQTNKELTIARTNILVNSPVILSPK
jgi:hypothetical protein